MNKERLMNVLIQPHVSEKSATVAEKANQYVFRVVDDATKGEVRQAVELMFEVKVQDVNVLADWGQRLGFDTFVFWPVDNPLDQLTRFAEDVVPRVRQLTAGE